MMNADRIAKMPKASLARTSLRHTREWTANTPAATHNHLRQLVHGDGKVVLEAGVVIVVEHHVALVCEAQQTRREGAQPKGPFGVTDTITYTQNNRQKWANRQS
jgi:hypothetical protein